MSNESVYVAIGIACVVAVLLFIVFIIYCVKRHNDKENHRHQRERRLREERHRRQLMRTTMVRPPPYDPNRQNLFPSDREIPFTPPPAYKEVATPLPRNGQVVGIGDLPYGPPVYDYPAHDDVIPTISRNVPPPNTYYVGQNYSSNQANNNSSNQGHGHRTVHTMNMLNRRHADSLRQVRPSSSVSSDVIVVVPPPNQEFESRRRQPDVSGRRGGEQASTNNSSQNNDRRQPAGNNDTSDGGDNTRRQSYIPASHRGDDMRRSVSPAAVLGHSYNGRLPSANRGVQRGFYEDPLTVRSYGPAHNLGNGGADPSPYSTVVRSSLHQDEHSYRTSAHPISGVEDLALI
ncbi:unnamed protein product [Lymnaea stagnalis]|uniref:Uncharacterized protein n=1 Tax=Lymnaea stagnalis TaxID=6523 RepID=A0AAV2IFW9_LYMST